MSKLINDYIRCLNIGEGSESGSDKMVNALCVMDGETVVYSTLTFISLRKYLNCRIADIRHDLFHKDCKILPHDLKVLSLPLEKLTGYTPVVFLDEDEIVRKYTIGNLSALKNAEEYGVGKKKIRSILSNNDVKIISTMERSLKNLEKRKEEIIQIYHSSDITMYDLSRRFCVNQSTMSKFFREHSISTKSKPGTSKIIGNKEIEDEIVGMYTSGISAKSICKRYDVHHQTITRLLSSKGIELRGVKHDPLFDRLTDDDKYDIAEKYRKGLSTISLGKSYNVGHCAIIKVLKLLKVRIREKGVISEEYTKTYINKWYMSRVVIL